MDKHSANCTRCEKCEEESQRKDHERYMEWMRSMNEQESIRNYFLGAIALGSLAVFLATIVLSWIFGFKL